MADTDTDGQRPILARVGIERVVVLSEPSGGTRLVKIKKADGSIADVPAGHVHRLSEVETTLILRGLDRTGPLT